MVNGEEMKWRKDGDLRKLGVMEGKGKKFKKKNEDLEEVKM